MNTNRNLKQTHGFSNESRHDSQPLALKQLGSALDQALSDNSFCEAEAICRCILILAPRDLEAQLKLADLLSGQQRFNEAMDMLRSILELDPVQPRIRARLATLRLRRNTFEGVSSLVGATSQVQHQLGILLQERGRWQEACECFQSALGLDENNDDCRLALAETLLKLDEPDEALRHCDLLIKKGAAAPKLNSILGLAMLEIGRPERALAALDDAVDAAPDDMRLRWNRALTLLALGQWEQGWPEFELRWKQGPLPWQPAAPRWTGEKIDGALLLQADWGLGDALQMLRYLPLVRNRCQRLVLACPTVLHPILENSRWIDQLIAPDKLPDFAAAAPLLSLPGIFGTTVSNIPAPFQDFTMTGSSPVLKTLSQTKGLSVGLVWAGRTDHGNDLLRSIPIEFLLPLFGIDNLTFFSLQKDPVQPEFDAFVARHPEIGIRLINLAPYLNDLAKTAAAVASLDLVISVDTMIAHLAGSLGKTTWLLLPFAADWRWLAVGSFDGAYDDRTPWYPSIRLFRQKRRGDWPETIERVAAALRDVVAARS